MTTPVRVAVIGAGYLGRFHALIYAQLPAVDLVAVIDTDLTRAAQIGAEAGCAYSDDYRTVLDGVDAVSIVVPTSIHLEVACPFLARGIAVLLEKPIAATLEDGQAIVAAAERHGALLQIGHLERFNAGVMALAERIRSPRYLEAQRLSTFVERATDVDVVTDLMIHDIDIILALVDSPLTDVRAIGASVLTPHIDIASARLEFANGCVANVVASRVSDKRVRQIRVFQPQAYLALDFAAQTLDIAAPEPRSDPALRPVITRQHLTPPAVKPLDCEIAAFIAAVQTGDKPLVDGRVGLKALEVALQVRSRMAGVV